MAGLRTLLQVGESSGGGVNFDEFHVFNASKTSQNNGGSCCLWTVPAAVTWFAIELWGGGGGGAGACCCRSGWPGGSGSYARKIINNLSGDGGEQYTICAAGTTGCSTNCGTGCTGFASFVNINGGAVQACAQGGSPGGTRCYFQNNCACQSCAAQQCGSWIGGMGLCGVTGGAKGSAFCGANAWGYMPSAPFTPGGARGTMSYCNHTSGNGIGGDAQWPGGGGASAVSSSTAKQCGAPGAGGLVTIYYPVTS